MNKNENPRLLRFRDGFFFSLVLLEREYADLLAIRVALKPDASPEILRAIAIVWQLIDAVNRVRDLAQSTPGLRRSDPGFRAFLANTETAERFRHYVQHLRSELAKPSVDRFPVWGSFSWIDGADETLCHTALTGTLLDGTELNSCVYDRLEKRWVSRIALTVHGVVFNVDPIVQEAQAFCGRALKFIETKYGASLPPLETVNTISARFGFEKLG